MAISIDPDAAVQKVNISDHDLKFKTPCKICISGSSMSGKTEFMLKLMQFRELLFDTEFSEVFYCTPETSHLRYNPIFDRIKEYCPFIQFVSGFPDLEKFHLDIDVRPKIIFLDDLQETVLNDSRMLRLMTADSHHNNVSVCFSLQNFYSHSRFGRTIFRQIDYRVIFYNRLDLTEIRTLSHQICNHNPKFLIESFEFLLKNFPNNPPYILFDGHSKSSLKQLFVRTRIFPQEEGEEVRPIFFFPK